MSTCSFTIPFKKPSVCSKVFVESTIGFGDLEDSSSSSSSSLAPLNPHASPLQNKTKTEESLYRAFPTIGHFRLPTP